MKTITNRFESIVANYEKTSFLDRNHGYIQVAFNVALLLAANDLLVIIWRSMTGH